MFKTTKHIKQFNLNNHEDLTEYEGVLNNPNAMIISTIKEKLSDKVFSEEGKMESLSEKLVLVVTWQEKHI